MSTHSTPPRLLIARPALEIISAERCFAVARAGFTSLVVLLISATAFAEVHTVRFYATVTQIVSVQGNGAALAASLGVATGNLVTGNFSFDSEHFGGTDPAVRSYDNIALPFRLRVHGNARVYSFESLLNRITLWNQTFDEYDIISLSSVSSDLPPGIIAPQINTTWNDQTGVALADVALVPPPAGPWTIKQARLNGINDGQGNAFTVFAQMSSFASATPSDGELVTFTRAYNLGPAGHIDDLGLIDGQRHLVIQQSGEIRIIEIGTAGATVRARITNPLSGDWGNMLTVVPDVNGDGVNDIATYGRDSQITGHVWFYMLNGNQPAGSAVTGDAAAIYVIPFGNELLMHAAAKPATSEMLLTELFAGAIRRRDAANGTILHTVTGPSIAAGGTWVGDFDGDSVPDYLTGGTHTLSSAANPIYLISGADSVDGTAASRAIRTFSDAFTPGLGYAEDGNRIAAAIGDITGDGVSELAIGSRLYRLDAAGNNYGRVVVFNGASAAVLYRIDPDQTHTNGVYFGNNIVAAGDLNGDGSGDFIVSARGYSQTPGGFGDGAIIGFNGADGVELFRYYGFGETMGDYVITRLADLNSDGVDDFAVGGGATSSVGGASIWLSGVPQNDTTAPEIVCATPDGSWHNTNVSILCTATDLESGLANGGDANFSLETSVPSDTELGNAGTNTREICDVAGNCSTAGPIAGNMIDRKAPVVNCAPVDEVWHADNVSLGCSSTDGGSGVAAPGDTAFSLSTNLGPGSESPNVSTASRDVCDAVGNCIGAGPIAGNKIDRKAPAITCAATDGLWHATDVTLGCTSVDGGAGLALSSDASFSLSTGVSAGSESSNAATGSRVICDSTSNCATAGPIAGNKVDKKAPAISIASPADGATYQLNSTIGASYMCADGGSGVASCQGPVASGGAVTMSTTGVQTFTVTSTDEVGNVSSATVTYNVITGGGGGQTSADVGITQLAPAKIAPGGTLTYVLTVTNAGRATATGVTIQDALPTGTAFVSASSTQGTVSAPPAGTNGTVIVNLGSLANRGSATVNIVVMVTAANGTVLSNTAAVTAATQDLNSSNNSATRKTTVK